MILQIKRWLAPPMFPDDEIIRNITERKKAEDILRARLRLIEFSDTHSLDELLQATLDELEKLTDSSIGFYHFLAEDQRTLMLQTWSTNTLQSMCTTEGKGMHYSIEQAGVWTDCIHERRPVIHNDYDSLPHRKGLPKGHAPVIRELVVPILRGEKIMAILGVGNKPRNYDSNDIEVVSQLADFAWDITERKRMEEDLRKSEEKYRHLVNTMNEGLGVQDKDGLITFMNRRGCEMLGYKLEELMGKPTTFVFDEENRRILSEQMSKRRRGERQSYEIGWLCKDGSKIDTIVTPNPQFDDKGNLIQSVAVFTDITERKQAEERLRVFNEQLRALTGRLQSVREEERTVIAREIHDELGQTLTGLKMDLFWLEKRLPKREELVDKTRSMMKLIDSTIQTVRKISTELRPGILDDLGLIAAIEWQAKDFENRTGIKCKFVSNLEEVELDQDRSTAMFRILQETLTNVFRHAKAAEVKVDMEAGQDHLLMKVADNGIGIRERDVLNPKSFGLLGMRERAHLFGGGVDIKGEHGKGTTVTVKIPLSK